MEQAFKRDGRVGAKTMAGLLPVGTKAPDFEGIDQDEKPVRLRDFAGRPVVLYFYPADMTTGCTIEACDFRDAQEEFRRFGAVVLGVSVQDAATHREFRDKHGLNFSLIADTDKAICRAYNTLSFLGVAKRVTYVLGPDGTILAALKSINPKPHSREALQVVAEFVRDHGAPTGEAPSRADPTAHHSEI